MARFISRGLKEQKFTVDVSNSAADGEFMAVQGKYDLIILDLMLPDKDGLDVCRGLRQNKIITPILMLTARDALKDKVAGLNAGADDYLVKPFAFEELLARVRALLRRTSGSSEKSVLSAGNIKLDLLKHVLSKGGKEITLTALEYKMLEYLMRREGQLVTRTALYEQVWGIDFDTDTNLCDVYVNHLRRKIGADRIKTVRGGGYVFQK